MTAIGEFSNKDETVGFYIVFSSYSGKYFLPTNRHDCDKYSSVFNTLVSIKHKINQPIGTCVNITPDIMCIIDRGDGEPESRTKATALVALIMNTVKDMKDIGRNTTVFLPTLRNNYIVNSKYIGLLLNENVQLVFV